MNSTFLLYGFIKRGLSKHSANLILYREKCSIYLQVTNLFFSSMSNWLNNELKKKNDEAKKKVRHLDKNHMKDFKNVRNRICSRIDNIDKMRRKLRGNKHTEVRKNFINLQSIESSPDSNRFVPVVQHRFILVNNIQDLYSRFFVTLNPSGLAHAQNILTKSEPIIPNHILHALICY